MLRSQQLEALAQQERNFDKAMMLLLQSHDATLAEEEQEMGLSNDITRPSLEGAEEYASHLLHTADALGKAASLVNQMERHGWSGITSEPEASEHVQTTAEDTCRNLRLLAQRLDRAAIVKHQTKSENGGQEMGLSNLSPGQQILHDLRLANEEADRIIGRGRVSFKQGAQNMRPALDATVEQSSAIQPKQGSTKLTAQDALNWAKKDKGGGMANTPLDEAAPYETDYAGNTLPPEHQKALRNSAQEMLKLWAQVAHPDSMSSPKHKEYANNQIRAINQSLGKSKEVGTSNASLDEPITTMDKSIEGDVPGQVGTCTECGCSPCCCSDPGATPSSQRTTAAMSPGRMVIRELQQQRVMRERMSRAADPLPKY